MGPLHFRCGASTECRGSLTPPRHPGAARRSLGSRAADAARFGTGCGSGFRARLRRPGMTAWGRAVPLLRRMRVVDLVEIQGRRVDHDLRPADDLELAQDL